jgi:hypothetical protein
MSHMCPKVLASLALAFALLIFSDAPARAVLRLDFVRSRLLLSMTANAV